MKNQNFEKFVDILKLTKFKLLKGLSKTKN